MKTRGTLVYLAIAFGVAWGIWAILDLVGISGADPAFQWWNTTAIPALSPPIFPVAIVGTILQALPVSLLVWGEEFSWRGYLQPRLTLLGGFQLDDSELQWPLCLDPTGNDLRLDCLQRSTTPK